ncbi:MAG: two-component regulator propeller domain-containing protein, partial [candidate division WOR-3 bacterium]
MKIVIILLCISIAALLPSNSVSQEWLNFNLNNSKLPSNYIWNFSSDSLGRIWIATSDGICYFDNGKIEIPMHIHNALPTNRTTCINFTNSGKMLIGTYEGFCIYENNNLSCYNTSNSILPRNFVLWVSADDDENIWICTQAGLVRMKNGEMNLYNSSNSPSPADLFTYAYKNKFGQELWIGTLRGAIKIIGEKWVSYNPNNSKLTNYPIWAITSNDKETVFGCNKLVKYKNDSWEEVPDDSLGLGNTNIRGLVYDLKGNLYVSSWGGGLSIYNGSFWKYLNTSNSRLITNDLSRIFVDDFNNKWIGSNEHGVFIYNEDGITLSSVVNDNESRK